MIQQIIPRLKSQNTWCLLGLSIITYLVYPAHYIKRQSKIINEYCDTEDRISEGFVATIFIFAYLSLALFFPYMLVDEGHPIERVSDLVDKISVITFLIWGFKARNRMNKILDSKVESKEWFHGLWTFLFTPFCFNFKVNELNEEVQIARALHGGGEPRI